MRVLTPVEFLGPVDLLNYATLPQTAEEGTILLHNWKLYCYTSDQEWVPAFTDGAATYAANYASLPGVGASGGIYVTTDNFRVYGWNGSAYVPLSFDDAVTFKGNLDCSSNPDYPAASVGALYRVSVAGKIGGASGLAVGIGDLIFCIEDSVTGDQATVGSNFSLIQGKITDYLSSAAIGVTVQGFDAATAKTDEAQEWTAQQTPSNGVLTDAATVAWSCTSNGQVVSLTTTASRTIGAPTDVVENTFYCLKLTTGGFTPSWNSAFKWAAGSIPAGLVAGTYIFTFIGGPAGEMIPTGPGYLTGA